MVVHIMGNLSGPFFLVLHEFIIVIIKRRELLKERHELIVGAVLLYLLVRLTIQSAHVIHQLP